MTRVLMPGRPNFLGVTRIDFRVESRPVDFLSKDQKWVFRVQDQRKLRSEEIGVRLGRFRLHKSLSFSSHDWVYNREYTIQ